MADGVFERIGAFISALLKPEKFDELPEAQVDSTRKNLFAWLSQADALPLDEEVAGGAKVSLASWLFAAEPLPLDKPPQRSARTPFLAALFSRELLAEDPVPARRPDVHGRRSGGGAN